MSDLMAMFQYSINVPGHVYADFMEKCRRSKKINKSNSFCVLLFKLMLIHKTTGVEANLRVSLSEILKCWSKGLSKRPFISGHKKR